MMRLSMRVWDLPVRLFHAAVILLLIVGGATLRGHHLRWHAIAGEALLALLIWRLIWGIVGSDTARLAAFTLPPKIPRGVDDSFGHAASGGWLLLLLLGLLFALTLSGLAGVAAIHAAAFWLVVAAIVLHVGLVALGRTGESRSRAIIGGKKRMPAAMKAPRMGSPGLAVLVLACAAGGVLAVVNFLGR